MKTEFDWSLLSNNINGISPKWVSHRTHFLTIHGSRAYSTNIESSDTDYRGICIGPKELYLGSSSNFEQLTLNEKTDAVIFEIRKFIQLAVKCNPNALEIIFTDPQHHLIMTSVGRKLIDNRDLFLSRAARQTFHGYAHAQAARISSHKRWLMNPPAKKPEREDFNLSKNYTEIASEQLNAVFAMIAKKNDEWNWHDLELTSMADRLRIQEEFNRRLFEITQSTIDELSFMSACRVLGFSDNFIELLNKEKQYRSAVKEWDQYQTWVKNRNPKRAELEAKFGFDLKHAVHLVRLSRSCYELLSTGKLNVNRAGIDADELLAIRNGAWTYEQLETWFEEQATRNREAEKNSPLPKTCDMEKIDKLCIELIEECLRVDFDAK